MPKKNLVGYDIDSEDEEEHEQADEPRDAVQQPDAQPDGVAAADVIADDAKGGSDRSASREAAVSSTTSFAGVDAASPGGQGGEGEGGMDVEDALKTAANGELDELSDLPPLPAEPGVRPSDEFLDCMRNLHGYKERGITINQKMRENIQLKNPYILQGIMEKFQIEDPDVSNYPTHLYDPKTFAQPSEYFEELVKAQNELLMNPRKSPSGSPQQPNGGVPPAMPTPQGVLVMA